MNSFSKPVRLKNIYVQVIGIKLCDVEKIIEKSRLKSKISEFLRISHIIGRGFLNMR
ncbi:endonuclease dU [Methanococcus vannielii]|uniref:endonuclease dU n=1 Tax=Methanococcus vannielii TaxID=2187 RepID=UPI0000F0C16C|nr:DUF99 family protein [Methanococcus vannielii]